MFPTSLSLLLGIKFQRKHLVNASYTIDLCVNNKEETFSVPDARIQKITLVANHVPKIKTRKWPPISVAYKRNA